MKNDYKVNKKYKPSREKLTTDHHTSVYSATVCTG